MSFKRKMHKTSHKNSANQHKMIAFSYNLSISKPKCLWYNSVEQVVYTEKGADGMYSAMLIAKYILKWFYDCDEFISNLKLQKLLYYVQGFCLDALDEPCFSDAIQAWKHGPVIPPVYREFSPFLSGPIIFFDEYFDGEIAESVTDMIDDVLEAFSIFGAWDLVEMTHRESPWRDFYVDGVLDIEIPLDAMREAFAGRSLVDEDS